MKKIELIKVNHNLSAGIKCDFIEPNINEDCIFYEGGKAIGFYIRNMSEKLTNLSNIANNEFLSERVPKSSMNRTSGEQGRGQKLSQYSTILGSSAPRPHMRRPYGSISRVHSVKSAQTFIKSMVMMAVESENIIKEILPEQYEIQKNIFKDVNEKWKFGNLFTSSISNFNINAPYHRDTGNFQNTVNVIITKRRNAKGGCLNVPDYNATIEQCDNSMLVYPAWRNLHGVTPIIKTHDDGYRNSLIFYPLKAFKNLL